MEITGPLTIGVADSSAGTRHAIHIDFKPDYWTLDIAHQGEVFRSYLDDLVAADGAPTQPELQAAITANADDLIAQFQLAAVALIKDDYASSLASLIEILHREKPWMQGRTRRALLAVFDTLGPEHGFVRPYRGELFKLTH